jgi:Fe-S cluster assembly ATPase SufC
VADYHVKIENCNSIDCADIIIKKGGLNIKYGPNGLGKSSIARAIVSQARNDGTLQELVPFKCRGKVSSN